MDEAMRSIEPQEMGGPIAALPAEADIHLAQAPQSPALDDLFARLHIKRVVFVDDMIEPVADAASVIETLTQREDARQPLEAFFPEAILADDNEARFDQLSAMLEGMDANSLEAVKAVLGEFASEEGVRDIWQLRRNIPNQVELQILTPIEWHAQQHAIVEQCNETARTLFLFDQELNADPHTLGFATGADIIKSLSQSEPVGFGTRWFCGMLSSTLNAGDEISKWRQLAAENEISLKFFMPIAKQSLGDGDRFYGSVYRTLINTYCETMKHQAAYGLQKALDAAITRLDNIDPLAFEHMVVNSSEKEGVSELETLLRLYAIVHKDEAKRVILREAEFLKFADAATGVKAVADISRDLTAETQAHLNLLRAQELHDSAELVNGYNDPLRNGDVFEIGEGNDLGLFVLVAQPCDIMVRPGGKRIRENNFKVAVICPLTSNPEEVEAEPAHLKHLVTNFGDIGDLTAAILFKRGTVANLNVLDLAVLDKNGRCDINPSDVKKEPKRFPTRAWQERCLELAKQYGRVATEIEDVRKKHGDEVADLIAKTTLPRVGMSHGLKGYGTYADGAFHYPIRRIGRIRDPGAASLLAAFGRFLSRDALEHDFARQT
ncbi:hypothetical protein [Sphingobium cloacae]|uniref:Uncharacterized protein n=1 Tax=Sphingobium cloacae TaxID=120107 RepID=A0A1E1F3M4_9SPHN|nr:hypothetical protein [Sphingobium cloacae]BAV65107.1 hypothetical protein SCLO_1020670 [Sphingobium cloacae]